jgi:hypothetical protein
MSKLTRFITWEHNTHDWKQKTEIRVEKNSPTEKETGVKFRQSWIVHYGYLDTSG